MNTGSNPAVLCNDNIINMKRKAILIDPETSTVTVVEFDGYKDIQKLIGCDVFTTGCYVGKDVIFVDDEGLLKLNDVKLGFTIGAHQPLAGKGLVCGHDGEGEGVDCESNVIEVAAALEFVTFMV